MNERDDSQRLRLFFCPPVGEAAWAVGDRVRLDRQESHHLLQVLRTRNTARLQLTDGRGAFMTGRLCGHAGGRAEIELEVIEVDRDAMAAPQVVLACAVIKGRRFEWVIEKAVELGVHRLVPLVTDRTVVRPRPSKQQRFATLATAALKQSGRSFLPSVAEPTELNVALAAQPTGPRFWGAAPADVAGAAVEPLPWSCLSERCGPGSGTDTRLDDRPASLTFLVGPEGGWSRGEYASLVAANVVPVALGPHVLRTETAAIVGLLSLQALRAAWLAG